MMFILSNLSRNLKRQLKNKEEGCLTKKKHIDYMSFVIISFEGMFFFYVPFYFVTAVYLRKCHGTDA